MAFKMLNGELVKITAAEAAAIRAGAEVPQTAITFKKDIWQRCTEEEAEALNAALLMAPLRQRKMFEDAQYLSHGDDLFPAVRAAVEAACGFDRAAAILSPSEA